MNRRNLYWICQASGWGLFVAGNLLTASLFGRSDERSLAAVSVLTLVFGIGLSHALRFVIHRYAWKRLTPSSLVPRVLISSLLLGFLFVILSTALTALIAGRYPEAGRGELGALMLNGLNFSVVFLIWEIIYFTFHTFRNWKHEQIQNLELRAANTEIELNSFKAQLNPHFIFNSLNCIRALVDENPPECKRAISMLSGILRSSLLNGRNQTVTLRQELDLVEKYLAMEKIRFEERLQISVNVDPSLLGVEIPPFMIQTLAENGIKHGISRLKGGGLVSLDISRRDEGVAVVIRNSGRYEPDAQSEGIGLANTRKRLGLLYGDKAAVTIGNRDGVVETVLIIPVISQAIP
jgi:two-component system, LytTR family, sensor kinase